MFFDSLFSQYYLCSPFIIVQEHHMWRIRFCSFSRSWKFEYYSVRIVVSLGYGMAGWLPTISINFIRYIVLLVLPTLQTSPDRCWNLEHDDWKNEKAITHLQQDMLSWKFHRECILSSSTSSPNFIQSEQVLWKTTMSFILYLLTFSFSFQLSNMFSAYLSWT